MSFFYCDKRHIGDFPTSYVGKYKTAKGGDTFTLGDTKLKVIHTPGHSPGSITISTENELFVGDTVFSGGSYGRTDLPGGDEAFLFSSIKSILSEDENKKVYCGHGVETTVKELKSYFI